MTFTVENTGQEVTCPFGGSFEWNTDTDDLEAFTRASPGTDGPCSRTSVYVWVTYKTPEGRTVTHSSTGYGGHVAAFYGDATSDVRTTHQVYFWEGDVYTERFSLPK
jgi:hypothetical protein